MADDIPIVPPTPPTGITVAGLDGHIYYIRKDAVKAYSDRGAYRILWVDVLGKLEVLDTGSELYERLGF